MCSPLSPPLCPQIIAQFCGAAIASLMLWGTSDLRAGGLGANSIAPSFTQGNAVLGEAIMTFILCYVVHLTAIDKNSPPSTNGLAPIAIGFAVFMVSPAPSLSCCCLPPGPDAWQP